MAQPQKSTVGSIHSMETNIISAGSGKGHRSYHNSPSPNGGPDSNLSFPHKLFLSNCDDICCDHNCPNDLKYRSIGHQQSVFDIFAHEEKSSETAQTCYDFYLHGFLFLKSPISCAQL